MKPLVILIEFWQQFISPLYSWTDCCQFTPSCSEYTKQAITKYGALKGVRLGAWRILRCNPFTKGGHDPVK